ncbi:AfsA-related hotdog domain-containing protein [Streptomyces sp. NPDC059445]|uniref:AfsA-related hotdog domain-containing protein n=1 Tax=Streptomyces sp. NPDC059445 TaxID=3346832 RepID=UPI00368E1DCA
MNLITTESSPGTHDLPRLTTTVPKEYVHRASLAEVFLTSCTPQTPLTYTLTGQWPRAHPYFTTPDGTAHDPLQVAETLRQAGMLLAHTGLNVPLGHHFILWNLTYTTHPHHLTIGPTPTDFTIHAHCTHLNQRRHTINRATLHMTIHRNNTPIAHGTATFSTTNPTTYTRLRGTPTHTPTPTPTGTGAAGTAADSTTGAETAGTAGASGAAARTDRTRGTAGDTATTGGTGDTAGTITTGGTSSTGTSDTAGTAGTITAGGTAGTARTPGTARTAGVTTPGGTAWTAGTTTTGDTAGMTATAGTAGTAGTPAGMAGTATASATTNSLGTPGTVHHAPMPPATVNRRTPHDVVLTPTDHPHHWLLTPNHNHPTLFDHPTDHIPGMVLIEAARQAAYHASGSPHYTPTTATTTFHRYTELDQPCHIHITRITPDNNTTTTIEITGTQNNQTTFTTTTTGPTTPPTTPTTA